MNIVTKTDIIKKIAEETGLTKINVKTVVESFFANVEEELTNGNKVQLQSIGTFEVKESKERKGRNPRNPDITIAIPACKRPVFKYSGSVKDRLNGK